MLTVTEMLPNGSTILRDMDFYDRLAYGDASVGWIGDPRLGVYWFDGQLEIRRMADDGEMVLIARSPYGCTTLDTALLRWLAEHDSQSRRAYDVNLELDRHNAAVERRNDEAVNDKIADAADRLAHALKREMGYMEGTSRFVYPGVDVPKVKD